MKRIQLAHILCLSLLIFGAIRVEATVISKTIGTTGADYTSIAAAITDINSGTIAGTGGLILTLQADYNQTSETIGAVTGASATDSVFIRPAATLSVANTAWTLSGSYINIDGRVGGTGSTNALTLSNTSASGVTLTVTGTNNNIRFVTLQGMNSIITAGVVVFGASTGNRIDHCDIRDVPSTGTPLNGIYSASASKNTVSNSNIYNYYSSTSTSNQIGINLGTGATGWSITGNSFYNTKTSTPRTFANGGMIVSAIYILNTSNTSAFTISNNYIGGQGPQCGGSGKDLMGLSTSSAGNGPKFKGIYLNTSNTYTNTISNNTIKNIAIGSSSAYQSAVLANMHGCIIVEAGAASITGNTIGNDVNSITYEFSQTTSGWLLYFSGIAVGGSGNCEVKNNVVGGITTKATTATQGAMNLWGIFSSTTGTMNIEANTIGSTTTGITSGTLMSIQNTPLGGASLTTVLGGDTKAIYCGTTGAVTIKNNTIANIYGSNITNKQCYGIGLSGTAAYTVFGNTIRDLIVACSNNGDAPHCGVYYTGDNTPVNVKIYSNTIFNIGSTATASKISGIYSYCAANIADGISAYNNLIYNLVPNTGGQQLTGIAVKSSSGASGCTNKIYNNIIRLGFDKLGNPITTDSYIYGIWDNQGTNGNTAMYFNTVYIGGGGVIANGNYKTACLSSWATPSAVGRFIQNNIFVNARTNNTGSGKHYAVYFDSSTTTNSTSSNNDYYASSGFLGFYSADKTGLTSGSLFAGDANSINVLPVFIGAETLTPNLHLYNVSPNNNNLWGLGIAVASVTADIDGDTRTAPPTLGADDNGIADVLASSTDLSTLQTAIDNAQTLYNGATEGSTAGLYLTGSKAILQTAIIAAQTVHDASNVTIAQINTATTNLANAVTIFNNGREGTQINLDQLTVTITSANSYYNASVEGTNPGNYSSTVRLALSTAISSAQTVHDAQNSNDTQLTVANTTLSTAITTFRNSINVTMNNVVTDGNYFISVTSGNAYYLTDVSPHASAGSTYTVQPIDLESQAVADSSKYQVFTLTYDATQSRYRIDGKYRADNAYYSQLYKGNVGSTYYQWSYVNENAYFGREIYSNTYNTYGLKYDGTHYAIQRGGLANTNYWTPVSYAPGAVIATSETNLYNSIVYTITPAISIVATSNDATKGTVRGAGYFVSAGSASLIATPANVGSQFVNWTEGGTEVSTSATYTFTVSSTRTLVANFVSVPVVISSDTNASTLINCATCDVTVANGATLTIDATKTLNSITIAGGGKVTNSIGSTLTASAITINSSALNGTGTFVDNGTTNIPAASVQQYLTSGRNWYLSSPVASAPISVISNASALYSFDESTAAGTWSLVSSGNLTPLKGYVAKVDGTTGVVTFTGGALNTGAISNTSIGTTLTGTAGNTYRGFNLVGNPYPSYVNWEMAYAAAINLESSIWYRTLNASSYVFDTYNAADHLGTSNNNNSLVQVTQYIAPMQAVWVRVVAGTTGTLGFDNTMRSHQDQTIATNRLKAKATSIQSGQQVLRLQVSNGTKSDQAIVLFNANASDGYDLYDSPKMSNNNPAIPEIYTTVGNENVVINGLNSVTINQDIPLGFTTGQSNAFSIKATEISNFDTGTRVILKDKLLNTEQDLSVDSTYSFTSDVASTTSRFSVLFKSVGVTTGVNQAGDDQALIYKNENNQITVNCKGAISRDAIVSVYNVLGQKLESKQITSTTTVIGKTFTSGVYVVTVNNGGENTTKEVILN